MSTGGLGNWIFGWRFCPTAYRGTQGKGVDQIAEDLEESEKKTKALKTRQRTELLAKAKEADKQIEKIRELLQSNQQSSARVETIDLMMTRKTFRAMEENYKMIGGLQNTISRAKMAVAAVEAGSSVMHALRGVDSEKVASILGTFEAASKKYQDLVDNVSELEGETKEFRLGDIEENDDDIAVLMREIAEHKPTHAILLNTDTMEDVGYASAAQVSGTRPAENTVQLLDVAVSGAEGMNLPASTGAHYAENDYSDSEDADAHAVRAHDQYQSDTEVQSRVVSNTLHAAGPAQYEEEEEVDTDLEDRRQADALLG